MLMTEEQYRELMRLAFPLSWWRVGSRPLALGNVDTAIAVLAQALWAIEPEIAKDELAKASG